ncbi:MAG: 3-phosphoshikimate 1-carboxyvinyltransferase [Clostridiales bacterium]|nr:3-phosphoshikimate 1-carboxyvinyltransferase [Clostridiales bacterium]
MITARLENSHLAGTVKLPPGKSEAHRAIICSALAGGGTVSPLSDSKDMQATLGAVGVLKNGGSVINCIESASAMRFLIPVAAALGRHITFVGEGSLLSRSVGEYITLLPEHGVECKSGGTLPLEISGQLEGGVYNISGSVSSQYTTGLLLALPLLESDSEIHFTTPLESKPYIDITISVMRSFGVHVHETPYGYFVKGKQTYQKCNYTVSGDWSHAAFFMAAGAIGGNVRLTGLDLASPQGDKKVCEIMRMFGANVKEKDGAVSCSGGNLAGIELDCTDIPDMVPSIAVTAAFAKTKSRLTGVKRLRLKESDRIKAICENLSKMGSHVSCGDDFIEICPASLHGAELCGYNDHRIVMAFSAAALYAQGASTITDAESINKSYPSFFDDYNSIGGKAYVIGNGK